MRFSFALAHFLGLIFHLPEERSGQGIPLRLPCHGLTISAQLLAHMPAATTIANKWKDSTKIGSNLFVFHSLEIKYLTF